MLRVIHINPTISNNAKSLFSLLLGTQPNIRNLFGRRNIESGRMFIIVSINIKLFLNPLQYFWNILFACIMF